MIRSDVELIASLAFNAWLVWRIFTWRKKLCALEAEEFVPASRSSNFDSRDEIFNQDQILGRFFTIFRIAQDRFQTLKCGNKLSWVIRAHHSPAGG